MLVWHTREDVLADVALALGPPEGFCRCGDPLAAAQCMRCADELAAECTPPSSPIASTDAGAQPSRRPIPPLINLDAMVPEPRFVLPPIRDTRVFKTYITSVQQRLERLFIEQGYQPLYKAPFNMGLLPHVLLGTVLRRHPNSLVYFSTTHLADPTKAYEEMGWSFMTQHIAWTSGNHPSSCWKCSPSGDGQLVYLFDPALATQHFDTDNYGSFEGAGAEALLNHNEFLNFSHLKVAAGTSTTDRDTVKALILAAREKGQTHSIGNLSVNNHQANSLAGFVIFPGLLDSILADKVIVLPKEVSGNRPMYKQLGGSSKGRRSTYQPYGHHNWEGGRIGCCTIRHTLVNAPLWLPGFCLPGFCLAPVTVPPPPAHTLDNAPLCIPGACLAPVSAPPPPAPEGDAEQVDRCQHNMALTLQQDEYELDPVDHLKSFFEW